MTGTIFFICFTPVISAYSAALRISAWPAAPQRLRRGCKTRKVTTRSWQSQTRRRWTSPSVIKITIPTQRRVLKDGKVMLNCSQGKGTCSNREGSEVSESTKEICHQHREICGNWIPWTFRISQNSRRRFRRMKIQKSFSANHFHITRVSISHGESLLIREKDFVIGNRWIIWNTSMWTQTFAVYSCQSHFKLQFILDDIIHEIYDPSRIQSSKSVESLFRTTDKLISQVCPRLIGISPCGEDHLCSVIELFGSWHPQPASFPTRCYAWEASVQNQSQHGKARLNFLETRFLKDLDRIDGEQTEFEWRSFTGLTTLVIFDEIQKTMILNESANQSNSKKRSTSFQ